jgi:hypothetical protein
MYFAASFDEVRMPVMRFWRTMLYFPVDMNRSLSFRMSLKSPAVFFVSAISLLPLAACQSHGIFAPSADDRSPPATIPCCQYIVSGGVDHPGPRTLVAGDKVSTILARDFPYALGHPCTLVLIRQAPEGKTHQLIQLDPTGKLMDEKQDWALRNGDELVFPGGQGSNSTRNPTGPPPRAAD